MRTDTPVTIFRDQYVPFPYAIPSVALAFDLDAARTRVSSSFSIERRGEETADLVLDGIGLTLDSVHVNAVSWEGRYRLTDTQLILTGLPAQAEIRIVGFCAPESNSTLMGLYMSGGNYFTQCEAEGFRRITWFADRPDVMSRYDVTLRASADFEQLLSNGNLISTRVLDDGRREAVWQDPFPKPCYLFALVAGNFDCREITAPTQTGRDVLLQVFSDPGSADRTEWALESLHRAMQWDETRFGLELDLDRFMIVAVRDFNMGAMENKGLNIFNASYVLADPQTATDVNYDGVEAVVGHEYFHNWTGNRVTCRDWFQLSLKEGLTVFRDQEFSADMMARDLPEGLAASARAVKRIDDVVRLRGSQFAEDAGPMAHPIRPESYQEIGNFYTATVYEKGAEIIRMQHTLLGEAGFRAGMDEYFRRHDGQAVTCEDFVAAMETVYSADHPGQNLDQFRRWYSQAGTPRVQARLTYDAERRQATLTLSQQCAPVGVERRAGSQQPAKQPFHIPFAFGLLAATGEALPLAGADTTTGTVLLHLTQAEQHWTFDDIAQSPVPSLLRDFSAPVIVDYEWRDADLALLSAHDSNPFARWEAGQRLATRQIFEVLERGADQPTAVLNEHMLTAWRALLEDPALDDAYRARALTLPSVNILAEQMSPIDPAAMVQARESVLIALGKALAPLWQQWQVRTTVHEAYAPTPGQAGRRALNGLAQLYVAAAHTDPACTDRLSSHYAQADNMTDRFTALKLLVDWCEPSAARQALDDFYQRFQHDPLVVDKWFTVQAQGRHATVEDIERLMAHPAFTMRNPNRVRALVFQFALNNARGAHAADGSGYAFWSQMVLRLDALNPEVAARLARAMDSWSRYAPHLRDAMRQALETVLRHPTLSANVREIVSKAVDLGA